MQLPQQLQRKFTSRALDVLKRIQKDNDSSLVDLLEAIYDKQGSLGSNFLKSHELGRKHIAKLQEKVRKADNAGKLKRKGGVFVTHQTNALGAALKRAVAVASLYQHKSIGTQHLLYGVFYEMEHNELLKAVMAEEAKPLSELSHSLKTVLESGSQFPNFEDVDMLLLNQKDFEERLGKSFSDSNAQRLRKERSSIKFLKKPNSGKVNFPNQFGRDLTERARNGELDPLVGRTREVERLIQILCRRNKSNPLLIGEAGVGKTAIVQGLAQRIVEGKVPAFLANKKVYDLRLSLLVAGTMFRGEFEARLEAIVQEAKRNNVILFIDEIHNIVGAGSAQGSLDAANILKPPLAQGEIQVIGATTLDEYRKYIERDKALERRFQPVFIEEPSVASTIEILRGVKGLYEAHHNVSITDNALTAAVELSDRYIVDRFLPDKAIDILDEAAARTRSKKLQTDELIEIRKLTEALAECAVRKEREIERAAYDQAFEIKNQEKALRARIAVLEKTIAAQEKKRRPRLSDRDMEQVVADITGVPVERLSHSEKKRLQHLERELGQYIVGQKEAIESLARAIRRSRAGLSKAHRPLGSFLFMGPTGVGKTELTRRLAESVFGPRSLIKLDMSEFMEPHSISRLLGAPAGYVGYGDSAQLIQTIRQRPYSVVLFDEIEKAHPQVHNILLQIFEDGQLTDATGRAIDFRNAIVVLTSNIGTARFTERAALGFGAREKSGTHEADVKLREDFKSIEREALRELKDTLKPELINRLDEVIVFKPLDRKAITSIALQQLGELAKEFEGQYGATLHIPAATVRYIVDKSFKPRQGARLVSRVIERTVQDTVAAGLLDQGIKEGERLEVKIHKGAPKLLRRK